MGSICANSVLNRVCGSIPFKWHEGINDPKPYGALKVLWNYNKTCIVHDYRSTEICFGKKTINHKWAEEQRKLWTIPYLSPLPENATDKYLKKTGRLYNT
jgi:hypothetical protein